MKSINTTREYLVLNRAPTDHLRQIEGLQRATMEDLRTVVIASANDVTAELLHVRDREGRDGGPEVVETVSALVHATYDATGRVAEVEYVFIHTKKRAPDASKTLVFLASAREKPSLRHAAREKPSLRPAIRPLL